MTMPRRDLYHDIVKNALVKAGWSITHDPLILGDTELRIYRDWETDRKSTRLNSSHSRASRMPSSA